MTVDQVKELLAHETIPAEASLGTADTEQGRREDAFRYVLAVAKRIQQAGGTTWGVLSKLNGVNAFGFSADLLVNNDVGILRLYDVVLGSESTNATATFNYAGELTEVNRWVHPNDVVLDDSPSPPTPPPAPPPMLPQQDCLQCLKAINEILLAIQATVQHIATLQEEFGEIHADDVQQILSDINRERVLRLPWGLTGRLE